MRTLDRQVEQAVCLKSSSSSKLSFVKMLVCAGAAVCVWGGGGGGGVVVVISLCGRTYETETAMWGDVFLFSNDHFVPPVTLVLHGLLPLHPLCNIPVLLHNI